MARHWFGGDIPSFVFDRGGSDEAILVGGATITFHSAQTGGVQYVDLLVDAAAADHAVSIDTDPGFGSFGPLQGPDEVLLMWASADGGPRTAVLAWSVAVAVAAAATQAASAESSISGHVAATNPHALRMRDLADANTTDIAGATDGEVVSYDAASGLWIARSIEGVSGVVTVTDAQTITGQKTFTPAAVGTVGTILQAIAGQTADLLRGNNSSAQRNFWLDNRGQPRVTADAIDQVPLRIEQRSSGQTANLTNWQAVNNGAVLAWVDAAGRIRAPNTMYAPWIMGVSGADVVVGAGLTRVYNDTGTTLTFRAARASAGVAPVGDDIIIDVNKGGATILTTPLVIGESTNTSGKVTSFAVATIADGEYLTMDIDQLGDATPGDYITVQLAVY